MFPIQMSEKKKKKTVKGIAFFLFSTFKNCQKLFVSFPWVDPEGRRCRLILEMGDT